MLLRSDSTPPAVTRQTTSVSVVAVHGQGDEPVVDEHGVARLEILCKPGVAHGHALGAAGDRLGRECERVAVVQLDLPALERADAVLGALRVEHDGDGQIKLLRAAS